jgi:hypothetical protein
MVVCRYLYRTHNRAGGEGDIDNVANCPIASTVNWRAIEMTLKYLHPKRRHEQYNYFAKEENIHLQEKEIFFS